MFFPICWLNFVFCCVFFSRAATLNPLRLWIKSINMVCQVWNIPERIIRALVIYPLPLRVKTFYKWFRGLFLWRAHFITGVTTLESCLFSSKPFIQITIYACRHGLDNIVSTMHIPIEIITFYGISMHNHCDLEKMVRGGNYFRNSLIAG